MRIALFGADNSGQNSVTISNRNDVVSVYAQLLGGTEQPGHSVLITPDAPMNPFEAHKLGNMDVSELSNLSEEARFDPSGQPPEAQ